MQGYAPRHGMFMPYQQPYAHHPYGYMPMGPMPHHMAPPMMMPQVQGPVYINHHYPQARPYGEFPPTHRQQIEPQAYPHKFPGH